MLDVIKVIKEFYGYDAESVPAEVYINPSSGITVDNVKFHPEKRTDAYLAVSALVHRWYITTDVFGMDLGAPDDFDIREWKFFYISIKERSVIKEYDYDPNTEQPTRMTYSSNSFENYVCGALNDNLAGIRINRLESGLEATLRDDKFCIRAELNGDDFTWVISEADTPCLITRSEDLTAGNIPSDDLETLMAAIRYKIIDYCEFIAEEETSR